MWLVSSAKSKTEGDAGDNEVATNGTIRTSVQIVIGRSRVGKFSFNLLNVVVEWRLNDSADCSESKVIEVIAS